MKSRRYPNVVSLGDLTAALSYAEQQSLEAWSPSAPSHALELYTWLRSHPGQLKTTHACHCLSLGKRSLYRCLNWLRQHSFVTMSLNTAQRVWQCQEVPAAATERILVGFHRGIPLQAKRLFGVASSLSKEEQQALEQLLTGIAKPRQEKLLEAYLYLRAAPPEFFLADVFENSVSRDTTRAVIDDLEHMRLIVSNRQYNLIGVLSAEIREAMPQEIDIHLLSAFGGVSDDGYAHEPHVAPSTKLLRLYEAICADLDLPVPEPSGTDRAYALRLLSHNRYEDIRPYLVFFMYRTEYFAKLRDIIERFGSTFSTFYKNFGAITTAADYERVRSQDDDWWLYWLNADIKKQFAADVLEKVA